MSISSTSTYVHLQHSNESSDPCIRSFITPSKSNYPTNSTALKLHIVAGVDVLGRSQPKTSMSSFGAVRIPFDRWREACQRQTSQNGKQVLQQEAKKLFSEIFSTTSLMVGTFELTTKPAHQEALAQLLRELGPCFTESHLTRVWALHCLCGAIEGCQQLSHAMMNVLGNFLLTYCAPLEEEADEHDDTEESVRDAAVLCLAALVQSSVEETNVAVACQRVQLAQTGIEHRCATGEHKDEFMDHGYSTTPREQDIRGDLSLLPRSRRALCFDLIRAAVRGIETMPDPLADATGALAKFATFSASCLHGESDPRCLMQLLLMLRALQQAFLLHFDGANSVAFPVVDIFDAVAPYYPIQFTPPPNDKHGITRQGLQQALLAILTFGGYDKPGDRQSMLSLASGLIIERIEDDDSTAQDKLEAMEDLTALLSEPAAASRMSPESVRELSHALMATHTYAAEGVVASHRKQGSPHYCKALADMCRSLVRKVAAELEIHDDLWNVFVKETLQNNATLLATSPQSSKGRSTMAYLACLVASGGPRTLTITLEYCLPRLQDALSETEDEEKLTAAAYGIGAFFSSFEVAFATVGAMSVSIHPHPLEPYSSQMLGILGDLFENSQNEGLRIAVFSAIISLLMVTPSELLDDKVIQVIVDFVQALCSLVQSTEIEQEDLAGAVAKSLGSIVAVAMDENESGLSSVLRSSAEVRESIQQRILPSLMKSCLEPSTLPGKRFDILSIAYACRNSQNVAQRILDDIVNALYNRLKAGETDDAIGIVHLLAEILREGKANASVAFHKTSVNLVELVKVIGQASSGKRPNVRVEGTSMLELPSSTNEVNEKLGAVSV